MCHELEQADCAEYLTLTPTLPLTLTLTLTLTPALTPTLALTLTPEQADFAEDSTERRNLAIDAGVAFILTLTFTVTLTPTLALAVALAPAPTLTPGGPARLRREPARRAVR